MQNPLPKKKKVMFIGRTGVGKTTLTQALMGEKLHYHKTQYVNYHEYIIDPPGEYTEDKQFGFVLALYSYEVQLVALMASSTEQFSLYSPRCTAMSNRECIGIVTKIHEPKGHPELSASWLKEAGCKKIFFIDSITGEGLDELIDYFGWKNC